MKKEQHSPEEGGKENDVDYQWKGLQVAERVYLTDRYHDLFHSI